MLEPEEHCSFINKWTAPRLWAKFTNDHSTGCAATMAEKHHKQGSSPCLFVRARHAIASHQNTDCKFHVSKHDEASKQNSNPGLMFWPCWTSSARCRVMRECCPFMNKWTVSPLWAKFTNDHSTGCAATMATKNHKQGKAPAYMSGRGKQSQATSTLTARAPCVKNDQALAKLEPWDSCFGLFGPHQQVCVCV